MPTFFFDASDGTRIFTRHWPVAGTPTAIVQIAHGMGEHSERYGRLAEVLNSKGIEVYANDHRGHGQTAETEEALGHYADSRGWQKVTSDLATLTQHIRNEHPQPPLFLLGHSMGSFFSQQYAINQGDVLDGMILSASHGDVGLLRKVFIAICRVEKLRRGKHYRSPLTRMLSFDSFNKQFKPNRTSADWLSKDSEEVDKYVSDPFCGFDCTIGLWLDLLGGMGQISSRRQQKRVPKELPILILGGSMDPVTHGSKGIQQLRDEYRRAGVTSVETKIYHGGRHEMLNETNRDEVTTDILSWLDALIDRERKL